MKLNVVLLAVLAILAACKGGGGASNSVVDPGPTYIVSGTVSYDFVPITATGLNYAGKSQRPIRNVRIEARNTTSDAVIATSATDDSGNYSLNVPQSTSEFYISIVAQMATPSITIEDNTNSDAIYMGASNPVTLTGDMTLPNLNAPCGWAGTNAGGSYTSTRVSAPFAILDSLYSAYQKINTTRPSLSIPALKVNWSVNNAPVDGNVADGDIGTSHYDREELYILGQAQVDSDEYDKHVIIHEYGHFIEDKLSRSDSSGGAHSQGDKLHKSLAFGEGWGNAFSAMVFDPDVTYRDSYGSRQQSAFGFSMENGLDSNPGWFSESSMQQILYDLYDSASDGADTVSLGFGPLLDTMTGAQKITPALTSIFSFITGLKAAVPASAAAIDTLLIGKDIDPIQDAYGTAETNDGGDPGSLPIYNTLPLNNAGVVSQIAGEDFRYNELQNTRFFKFTATSATTRISWNSSDTFLLYIYKTGSLLHEIAEESTGPAIIGSQNVTTVAGQQYSILFFTVPGYIFDINNPINITLSAQAL